MSGSSPWNSIAVRVRYLKIYFVLNAFRVFVDAVTQCHVLCFNKFLKRFCYPHKYNLKELHMLRRKLVASILVHDTARTQTIHSRWLLSSDAIGLGNELVLSRCTRYICLTFDCSLRGALAVSSIKPSSRCR